MEPEIHDRDKLLFVEGGEVEEGDIIVVSCRDRLFIKGIKKEVSRRPSIGGHLTGRRRPTSMLILMVMKMTLIYLVRF